MPLSRRSFIQRAAWTAGAMAVGCSRSAGAEPGSGILLNHVGFAPSAGKRCVMAGRAAVDFDVVTESGRSILQERMLPARCDFGSFAVGDLSALEQRGAYEIRVAGAGAAAFVVLPNVYDDAIGKCIRYFGHQRCGDSGRGYNAPCHLDDGVRGDNGARHDVTGGWHDACDVRKWVSATVFGLTGLYRVLNSPTGERIDRDLALEEMRWGNGYFLKMQEPDGSLMSYCGGDGGNHFTDNRAGTADDRRIHVETSELPEQFHFIAAQAALVRLIRATDRDYAARCEAAGRRCLEFCLTRRSARAAASVGAGVIACLEMHRTFGDATYAEQAAALADQLVELQVTPRQSREVHGFFLAKPDEAEPYRDVMHGNLPLLALCEACEHLEGHANRPRWRAALEAHCQFLLMMSARSAFGTVPFGLYAGGDPGGGRRVGDYGYRFFMKTRNETSTADWWVGINAHLASTGTGLCRAARILAHPQFTWLAQRQLDWILGANPFNASTVTGVGRNQPKLFVTREFSPPTPLIDGGVMNGIGGTAQDEPDLAPGSYHTCEYWTPMVAYTMWLMAELQA